MVVLTLVWSFWGTAVASAAPAPATITLAVTAAGATVTSVRSGTPVTLTATLASSNGTPYPGQVIFCDATAPFCQNASLGLAQVVNTAGIATASLSFTPGPGAHSYKAVFLGTSSYAKISSAPLSLTVTAAVPTTTTLTSTGSGGSYGLTAQISTGGTSAIPSGTVSFLDSTTAATLGSVPVTSGPPTFSLSSPTFPGYAPEFVGDFNGDGKLDFVAAGSATIELGNGDGTFSVAPNTPTNAVAEAIGDFNNDGKLDLVTITPSGSAATLLLGNGDGTFTSMPAPLPACGGNGVGGIAAGDFNNDGNADLIVTCSLNTATVLLGNGDGTFSTRTISSSVLMPGSRIQVGDFDADGNLDLAVSSWYTTPPYSGFVALLRGNGDGTFRDPSSITVVDPSGEASPFLAADFNGDGKLDLAFGTTVVPGTIPQDIGIMLNNGDGTFAAPVLTPVSLNILGVALAFTTVDLNGDGKADLMLVDQRGLSLLFSNGDGTFNLQPTSATVVSGPLAIGDFNGDGIPDIQAGGRSYLGLDTYSVAASLSNIAVGGSGTHSVTAAYSGDSAYAPSTSSAVSLNATLIPTTLSLSAAPGSSSFGSQITVTATLSPASLGNLSTNGGTVSFLSGTTTLGTATLSSGIATFSTTALPVGTDSVSASFHGDTNFSASTAPAIPVTITPLTPAVTLSASTLTYSIQAPSSTSAAQTITLTNSGQGPLTVASVIATGDFAPTSTCTSGPIAPLGTCVVSVTFTPSAAGSRTGTLTITDNAPSSPQTVSLTGTGAPISLNAAPNSLTISAPGGVATTSLQIAGASGFSGTVALSCTVTYQGPGTSILLPACALNPTQGTVAPGSPLSSTLTVTTTASTARLAPTGSAKGIRLAGVLLAGLLVPAGWRRRRLFTLLAVFCVLAGLSSCGGHSASSQPSTSTGSYQINVTAFANSVNVTTAINLAVE